MIGEYVPGYGHRWVLTNLSAHVRSYIRFVFFLTFLNTLIDNIYVNDCEGVIMRMNVTYVKVAIMPIGRSQHINHHR